MVMGASTACRPSRPASANARVAGQPPSTSPVAIALTRSVSALAAPPPKSSRTSTLSLPPDTRDRPSTNACGPNAWPLPLTWSIEANLSTSTCPPALSAVSRHAGTARTRAPASTAAPPDRMVHVIVVPPRDRSGRDGRACLGRYEGQWARPTVPARGLFAVSTVGGSPPPCCTVGVTFGRPWQVIGLCAATVAVLLPTAAAWPALSAPVRAGLLATPSLAVLAFGGRRLAVVAALTVAATAVHLAGYNPFADVACTSVCDDVTPLVP